MTRVIVHAGFHKTGTSSLQDQLRNIRTNLAPYAAIYLKEDFLDAGNAGRIYGLKPYPWRLMRFGRLLRGFLASIKTDDVIFLSWEGFAGVMPGHRRQGGKIARDMNTTAAPLAKTIVRELRRRFGNDVEITFLYTLRERESWIRSVYGHIVRSIRLTDDFTAFRSNLSDLPSLDQEAQQIAKAISPVVVTTSWLEKTRDHPQGPAITALRMIGVPEDVIGTLPPARHTNAGNSDEIRAQCLELNRTVKDSVDLKRRKDALTGYTRKTRN